MKEYPKINQLFSDNSEKFIHEDQERIVVDYMADITANATTRDLESVQQASRLILNCKKIISFTL